MRLRLAVLLPAHFCWDARRISKRLHSFCIAAANEHSLARRSWSLSLVPSWSHCVCCICNRSSSVLSHSLSLPFPFLFFFLVSPLLLSISVMKCFPVFGIGVSGAKLTRWEISVFSCWQSIYLPSNVWMRVRNECWKDGGWKVSWNCHPYAFLFWLTNDPFSGTTQLFMGHYTIMKNTITRERGRGFEAYFNKHAVNVKTSTKKWLFFFISTHEQFCIIIVFYWVLINQISQPVRGGKRREVYV